MKEKGASEDLGVDGRVILKRDMIGGCGLDSSGSAYGPLVGSCGHGNDLFEAYKRQKVSWLLSSCQRGLRSMELVVHLQNFSNLSTVYFLP